MPEYLAPGVYVEETSFRAKSIEGVSTTTTGFVGPSRFGPIDIEPDLITSISEFERTYGDREPLQFSNYTDPTDNYLWHGARAFFEEGGKRLYLARIFRPLASGDGTYKRPDFGQPGTPIGPDYQDGHARDRALAGSAGRVRITARFPGNAGNLRVRLTLRTGQNVLGQAGTLNTVTLQPFDLVVIHHAAAPNGALYTAERYFNPGLARNTWRFRGATGSPVELTSLNPNADPTVSDLVRVVTMTVTVTPLVRSGAELVWDSLALHPKHERAGTPDSVFGKFSPNPSSKAEARTLPIVVTAEAGITTGLDVLGVLTVNEPGFESPLGAKRMSLGDALTVKPVANIKVPPLTAPPTQPTDADLSVDLLLEGGNDGKRPVADDFQGAEDDKTKSKTGLVAFEDIEDISIIAAPGSTYLMSSSDWQAEGAATLNALIAHAQRMRYRIAVLDSGNEMAISEVRAMRAKIDSSYAALYYPWVRVIDPVTGTERNMPPSGFVAGIYARNDINRAVYKAPANEVVVSALGFETLLNKSQQDVLNPEGINCFRFFSGRGFRLWGARTISSDPEWKYVNLRRYFAYLEHSIDRGTQWAVFEPNGDALWANVRRTIEDFLLNEWQMGALLGDKPDKSFFVKCDRSTMTQNDLDNGRMVCLIGVAPLRPAEYVIFRIGQWTADRKV